MERTSAVDCTNFKASKTEHVNATSKQNIDPEETDTRGKTVLNSIKAYIILE